MKSANRGNTVGAFQLNFKADYELAFKLLTIFPTSC
jgi:hypothetical protein